MPPKLKPAKRVGNQRVPDPSKPKNKPKNESSPSRPNKKPSPEAELVKIPPTPSLLQYSTEYLDPDLRDWMEYDNTIAHRTRKRVAEKTEFLLTKTSKVDYKFTLFLKLPLELRLMIWAESTAEARLVPIYVTSTKRMNGHLPVITPCVPVLFHVCKESREFATKKYELIQYHDTSAAIRPIETGKVQLSPVYFNFEQDVFLSIVHEPNPESTSNYLVVDNSFSIPKLFPESFVSRLRHLTLRPEAFKSMAVTWEIPDSVVGPERVYQCLKRFVALEILYIIGWYDKAARGELPYHVGSDNDDFYDSVCTEIALAKIAHPDWDEPYVGYVEIAWQ